MRSHCYVRDVGLHKLKARAASQRALHSSRVLFNLPDELKKSLPSHSDNGFIRGFIGVGGESGSPTLFEAKVRLQENG
jgi:hypothetical protein